MFEYQNAAYNQDGSITCDVNHPYYGWVNVTVSPHDTIEAAVNLFLYVDQNGDATPYTE